MSNLRLETTPVFYNDSGIKLLSFTKRAGEPGFRLHWHERLEVIQVRSGKLFVETGKDSFEVSPGELTLFPPKMPHKGTVPEGSVNYDVLMFDVRNFYNETEAAKRFLSAMVNETARFQSVSSNPEIISCFDAFFKEREDGCLENVALVYRFLSLVFSHMLISVEDEIPTDATSRMILRYINEHFSEEISTADLSMRFGYSPSHFCRKFKEATWLSPMKYILILRLEKASKMLLEGEYPISVIAAKCGFSDQNYFSRCFKAHFGMSPRFYGKKATKEKG
jgi:AraC-like DNA-binding protein/mannose-6-phosphate isomerase-like protein (cupin superfamily)